MMACGREVVTYEVQRTGGWKYGKGKGGWREGSASLLRWNHLELLHAIVSYLPIIAPHSSKMFTPPGRLRLKLWRPPWRSISNSCSAAKVGRPTSWCLTACWTTLSFRISLPCLRAWQLQVGKWGQSWKIWTLRERIIHFMKWPIVMMVNSSSKPNITSLPWWFVIFISGQIGNGFHGFLVDLKYQFLTPSQDWLVVSTCFNPGKIW